MKYLLILASFICLLTSCRPVTVRDSDNYYEPEAKSYIYSESSLTPDSSGQSGQLQYYKAARRSGNVPTFQYPISEDANPDEADYTYPAEQPPESTPSSRESYEQQVAKRLGVAVRKPPVEQYLKEVSPTTKTVYNRRAGNYLRPNGQATASANKQTEETQRGIPFQYILQSESQQKPKVQQQIQYEIPEQKQISPQHITHQLEPIGLSRYQNALLAHQKVLLETSQDESSKSSIYVNHAIPKKPIRKLVKPKQSAVDEDVEYYAQLQQQYQQQLQQKEYYEQQQPAQVMYQAKLQHPKEDAPSEESLTYQQPQQPRQYQSPTNKKPRRPAKYQQEYRTIQEGLGPSYEHQTSTKSQPINERATSLRQGPKYLPEPKTVRYQPSPLEHDVKYQQVIPGQHQQPLITYEAALAKVQSQVQLRPQSIGQRPAYREQEQIQQTKYQVPYTEESQQGANQEDAGVEYIRPDQGSRLHLGSRGVVYRQPIQGSNVRYYRNLARPVQYSSYE